ncbi:M23 family metallopeptidase [Chitinivorax sp. PXF-14]|uniref:M23 family metallopeptidase n=1 Tax=Chitinivorax sp. PXF-14 TaxID=3230488 RepID=UPI003465A33D
MPTIPSHRRQPGRADYLVRQRRLSWIVSLGLVGLIGAGFYLWQAEPTWMGAPPATPGEAPADQGDDTSPELLQARLQALQDQWRRMEQLELSQLDRPAQRMSPAVALALQPMRKLEQDELRRRVDVLTQALGERLASLPSFKREGGQRLLPVAGVRPSSDFGLRQDPFTHRLAVHNGIDFVAPIGTPILAVDAGVVKSAGLTPQFGWSVELDHGHGVTTRYAHALRVVVVAGQQVAEGQKLAEVGSTGRSTGPHLHFEVRYNGVPLNPRRFLALK